MHLKGTKNSPASAFGILLFPTDPDWWQREPRPSEHFPQENLPEPLRVGPARPALPSGGSRDWPFVLYRRRSKWRQGCCPRAMEFRSVGVQLPLPPSFVHVVLWKLTGKPWQGTSPSSLSGQVPVGSPHPTAHSCQQLKLILRTLVCGPDAFRMC